jgi:hypothetical protein
MRLLRPSRELGVSCARFFADDLCFLIPGRTTRRCKI